MKRLFLLIFPIFISGCLGGCFPFWKSPSDLPSRVEVGISPETGQIMYTDPNTNTVVAYVTELETDVLKDYKLDRLDLLDGGVIIATQPVRPNWSGRLIFFDVKIKGPDARTGALYARIISNEDLTYNLLSDPWNYKVDASGPPIFTTEDRGKYLAIRIHEHPPKVIFVSLLFDSVNYGIFMCSESIMVPKPTKPTPLTFIWLDDDGNPIGSTDGVLQP
jgi:hypothetical protein